MPVELGEALLYIFFFHLVLSVRWLRNSAVMLEPGTSPLAVRHVPIPRFALDQLHHPYRQTGNPVPET
jgi:hypothetical protein